MGVFIKNFSKKELIKRLYFGLKPEQFHFELLSELDMTDLTTDVLCDREKAFMEGYVEGNIKGYIEGLTDAINAERKQEVANDIEKIEL